MRAKAWTWLAVLMLGVMGDTALAQAAKTREGTVKSVSPTSIQLEGATASAPPLTYVVDTSKPLLKKSLGVVKAGDRVLLTYAPNELGVKVVTDIEIR